VAVPTYRQRLRLEGAALTACGGVATVVLLLTSAQTTRGPSSTIIQLLIVAVLLAGLGPLSVRSAIAGSSALEPESMGSGEPTPLWHIAAIVLLLTVIVGEAAGWDAGLRVTIGCMLVGAAQALLLAGLVARVERARGRVYYRVAGSRILRGTKLGYVGAPRARPGAGPELRTTSP
jgi:hypothetical protein